MLSNRGYIKSGVGEPVIRKMLEPRFVNSLPLTDKLLFMAHASWERGLMEQKRSWALHYMLHAYMCALKPEGGVQGYGVDTNDSRRMAVLAYALKLRSNHAERADKIMKAINLEKVDGFKKGRPEQPLLSEDKFCQTVLFSEYYKMLVNKIDDSIFGKVGLDGSVFRNGVLEDRDGFYLTQYWGKNETRDDAFRKAFDAEQDPLNLAYKLNSIERRFLERSLKDGTLEVPGADRASKQAKKAEIIELLGAYGRVLQIKFMPLELHYEGPEEMALKN